MPLATDRDGMSRLDDVGGPERLNSQAELIERILDRGLVIDAEYHVSVAGLHLMRVDMWLVVASLDTYEKLASSEAGEALGLAVPPWMSAEESEGRPSAH